MLASEGNTSCSINFGTNLFVIVTGLQNEISVEQIRSCYENVGVVLRMKVYSTEFLANIAVLELDNTETLMRASCRRVQMGNYLTQAIYAYKQPMPEISLLIRKKTKLKLQYELKNKQDPQKYKDSLLQFLCKNAGYFNVKKCRCVENKGDITLSVESGFSLSKISGSSMFVFDTVAVNFCYVIDPIDEKCLRTVITPSYLTMSAKEPSTGANLNFVINTLCQNMKGNLVQDHILSDPTDNIILNAASWTPANLAEDNLETMQASGVSLTIRFLQNKNLQQAHLAHKFPMFFSHEQNSAFMQAFLQNQRTPNFFTEQIQKDYNQYPGFASGTTSFVPEKSEDKALPNSQSIQSGIIMVPVELKVVEILYKLVNLSATSTASTVHAVYQEVYTSIATKIDPTTPISQMLRVTLKILKTKFRKVKRRERKRENRVDQDADDQDESGEETHLSGPKADGHPLVYQVVSKLAKSSQTGYTFNSQDLQMVLQICDPDWRDFIWKYRTVRENHPAHLRYQQRECSDGLKIPKNLQQHLNEKAHTPKLAGQLAKTNSCDNSKNKSASCYKLTVNFRDQNNQEESKTKGAPSDFTQRLNDLPMKVQDNTYCPFRSGFSLPKPLLLELTLPTKSLDSVGLDSQATTGCHIADPAKRKLTGSTQPVAGSPTPHVTLQFRRDDLWSLQHIESNLRFNRMVSPMLWR
jgi:hypothetical protein